MLVEEGRGVRGGQITMDVGKRTRRVRRGMGRNADIS